jgi:hypothetical protein
MNEIENEHYCNDCLMNINNRNTIFSNYKKEKRRKEPET